MKLKIKEKTDQALSNGEKIIELSGTVDSEGVARMRKCFMFGEVEQESAL